MVDNFLNIQIYYEIALSLGTASELKPMVNKALGAYVKKLNCLSGAVYKYDIDQAGEVSFTPIAKIPRTSSECELLMSNYFSKHNNDFQSFTQALPIICDKIDGITGHLFALPGFGVLVLTKSGEPFDTALQSNLCMLNEKFANDCISCVRNVALAEREQKYRDIYETVQDVYFRSNKSGQLIDISPSIKLASGYSQSEVINQPLIEYFSKPEDYRNLSEILMSSGVVTDFKTKMLKKDGQFLHVSLNAQNAYDSQGNFTGFHGTIRDITENEQIAQKLITRENNQRVINYFATSLLGANTESEILWDIAYNCISRLNMEDCVIYMVDENHNILKQVAAYGSEKEKDYTIIDPITIPIGEGIVGSVAKTGISEVIGDVTKDPRYIVDDKIRYSELTVPIMYGDKVIGILDSEHSKKDFFTEDHLEIFEAIASLAGNKIVRAKAEESQKVADTLKSSIVENALDCIVTVDSEGLITDFNPAAEKTFGFKEKEIIGKTIAETIIPHKYRDLHKAGMDRYNKTQKSKIAGQRIEIEGLHASGRIFPIELTLTPIKLGEKRVFTAHIRDITESREAERQMKLQSDTLEAAANGIIITDIKGNILWANPSFLKMTGYNMDDILSQNTRMLKSGEHTKEFYKNLWDTIKSGNVWLGELINKKKDGINYYEEMTITPVKNKEGEITNFIAIKQDITERKKAEKILRDSESLKTDFVSSVSHELRTPLASILGFSGTILRDKNMKDEIKQEFVKIIFDESQRLTRLIENVLDISRIEAGTIKFPKESTMIPGIIEDVIESQSILARKKGVGIEIEISKNIPPMVASQDGIKQIAVNLISNAIKFTDPGGNVFVSVSVNEKFLVIRVKDTGIGIPKDDLNKIFERFYRVDNKKRQDEGTGIGLAIVKEIISHHKGTVEVLSEIGSGTEFIVKIPTDLKIE